MPIPSSVVSMSKSPDPPDPLRPSSPSVQASLTHLSIPTSPLNNAEGSPPSSSSKDLIAIKLQKSSIPAEIPSTAVPSYAERFKSSLKDLRKIASPSFLEDGTPVVQAPESVLLSTSDLWKDHIVAHFHGSIPPAKKIFDDLNPVWGKFGKITIRVTSETSCLIFVPSIQTREWVLQVGYWQAGHCAFSVFPWSPEGNLAPQDLESSPTWVVLQNVPPQLYSLDGISVIASGIGEPLHTEKSRLDPYNFGNTKIKVEIDLHGSLPPEVEVRDSAGFSVRVKVEYPSLPPKCCNCGCFGHYLNRCLMPPQKRKHADKASHTIISSKVAKVNSQIPLSESNANLEEPLNSVEAKEPGPSKNTLRRRKSRSRSRGRKNVRNNDTQEANMSQTQASGKQWVPIEIQQNNTVVTMEFKSDDSEPEKAEAAGQHEASLVDKVDKTEALEYAKVEGEVLEVSDHKKEEAVATKTLPSAGAFGDKESTDTKFDENPWQLMQSKKNKRAQRQGELWRSPSVPTAKELRFRVRSQAAALGRRL